jgi:hypothetical protein
MADGRARHVNHTSPVFFPSFKVFLGIVLVVSSIAALLFLVEVRHLLHAAGDNVYPEATGVASALRWAHGLPLYSSFQEPPYVLTAFPPLWYLCLRGAIQAGFRDPDSLTVFARGMSLAFLGALSLLAFFWNRRRGYTLGESALGPILYLAFPALLPWAVSARPDFPSLFFALAALTTATLRPRADGALLAGFLAGLGFLLRHSCVAAPTAIGLSLLLSKRWREMLMLCLGWAVPVVTILWKFDAASNGAMRTSLSGSNFGSMRINNAHEILTYLFTRAGYGFTGLLFAFGLLGLILAWKRSGDPAGRVLVFYFLLSLGLAGLGSSLAGAGENHYLEPALAASFLVPVGTSELRKRWPSDSLLPAFLCLLVLVVWLPTLDLRHWQAADRGPADFHALVTMVEKRNILTDIPYLAARTPSQEFLDATSLHYAEMVHRWSAAAVVRDLDAQLYDAVVLHDPLSRMDKEEGSDRYARLGTAIRQAIERNYGICYQMDSVSVYGRLFKEPSARQPVSCQSVSLQ